mmetsp:Transcript_22384/g.34644  ORF Transcript_22384/g.34644 Transcript_22384/m.34644 type:complete len:116 (+) Transcript_22384:231-578(+)
MTEKTNLEDSLLNSGPAKEQSSEQKPKPVKPKSLPGPLNPISTKTNSTNEEKKDEVSSATTRADSALKQKIEQLKKDLASQKSKHDEELVEMSELMTRLQGEVQGLKDENTYLQS